MRTVLVFAALLFISFPALAQVKNLTVDLAENHVDITTGFTGARLVLFGERKEDGDIAVVIRGPERTMVVRRKENVIGTWINRRSMKFRNVPLYYDFAVSRPEAALAKPEELKEHGIGLNALYFDPDTEREDPEFLQNFREALVRNKQARGLFPLKGKEVTFLSSDLFRASFYLPSNVPTGNYQVYTFLIKDGQIMERRATELRVAQVGFGARVFEFAQTRSLSYGLLCVFIAVAAGWMVNWLRPEA